MDSPVSYAGKWFCTDITKQIAIQQTMKYGHLLEWNNSEETCLEVGCGEGSITKEIFYPWIENRIQRLVAIDKLDGMIQFAKEHNSAEKLEYHTLDIMDNKMTKDMSKQYDHILSICVDHLIPDTRDFASVLHTLLRPDGQIFITTIVDNFFKRGLDQLYQTEKWSKYKPQQQIFTEYTSNPVLHISNLLEGIGFKVNECKLEKVSVATENFEGFVRALTDMYQNLGYISIDFSEDFVEDLTEKCKEQCTFIGEPDKYKIPYNILTWIASKVS